MAALASPSTSTNDFDSDIFSQRHHPNALKEHLLNMATDHRAQIAVKRPNPTHPQQQGMYHFFFNSLVSVQNKLIQTAFSPSNTARILLFRVSCNL